MDKGTEFVLTTVTPPLGLFYQVVSDKKITGMDLAFGLIPFGLIGDFIKSVRYLDDVGNVTREFESFADFKKMMGAAGEGKQWHHIVEQIQISKSGFSEQLINSTDNIIAIDKATHNKISGIFNTNIAGPGSIRVRDWLAGQSYEEQYKFGIHILKGLGVIP